MIVFNKAYINYKQFEAFTDRDIFYVTRRKTNAGYTNIEEFDLPDDAQHI